MMDNETTTADNWKPGMKPPEGYRIKYKPPHTPYLEKIEEDNGNIEEAKEKTKYGMEPALVLLINNETGMFEWQDIPHPSGSTSEGGEGWKFSILASALLELQVRLLGVTQTLWQKKIRELGLLGSGIQSASPDILDKLKQRGMRKR